MSDTTWEKSPELAAKLGLRSRGQSRLYLFVGILLIGLVAYFILFLGKERYYVTVDELLSDEANLGKSVRVAGAVVGDYEFDQDTQTLSFVIVNIPNDATEIREAGGLAKVLHDAVNDPNATPLRVVYRNAEVPDLLQHEAQAIVEGELAFENGEYVFYADSVQLKCPTRYSEENPQNVTEPVAPAENS